MYAYPQQMAPARPSVVAARPAAPLAGPRLGQVTMAKVLPDAVTILLGVGAYVGGRAAKQEVLKTGGVVLGAVGLAGLVKTLAS